MSKIKGLYIHVPFCVRKCAYCDFYSVPGEAGLVTRYVDSVLEEAAAYAGLSFNTLYIGGGTPGLLGANNLRRLVSGLRQAFDLSGLVEGTIELNPDSAPDEVMHAAEDAGINRVSIGVQSLSDYELESVGRLHNAAQALDAVKRARSKDFKSVSADLIVGLPGQTWDSLRGGIEALAGMGTNHLSLYCLSVEEGTPLAAKPPEDLPADDTQAELFESACQLLAGYGLVHYEISNFSLSSYECLHNLNYWRGGEYLGLGPAAASHLNGRRFCNHPDLFTYLDNPTGLKQEDEVLEPPAKAAEEAMLRLRLLNEGLSRAELINRFGGANVGGLIDRLDKLVADGGLVFNGDSYRLHPGRVLTSNPVFCRVFFPEIDVPYADFNRTVR